MIGGESLQQGGHAGELIPWNGIGNDQDAMMGAMIVEESEGEFDKVISISGYQASLLFARKLKLL
jgi:hypothetical protein